MLNTILLVIVIFVLAGMGAAVFLMSRKLRDFQDAQANDKGIIMINQNLQGMSERLDQTTSKISDRLDKAAHVIMGVQKELGTVQERFKGFEEFNELLHPKMRGNIGEQILEDMLAQVFPQEQFGLQHKFKDGQTVDAVVLTRGGIVPIDSKFPLENFKQLTRASTDQERALASREFVKAVRKHIDDIAKKYILPEEGTVNFAVMYVPSENVYYHIITDEEGGLMDHARAKSVLITSPHGFFNFLRVILMGLERSRLQEQAQKIWDILKGVELEAKRFGEPLGVLAKHLTNAKSSMEDLNSRYGKLTGKLEQVHLVGPSETVPALDSAEGNG
jgi:DNA recombination protein RmuC